MKHYKKYEREVSAFRHHEKEILLSTFPLKGDPEADSGFSQCTWEHLGTPQEEVESVTKDREVWANFHILMPPKIPQEMWKKSE